VKVVFEGVGSEDVFFRRCYLKVVKDEMGEGAEEEGGGGGGGWRGGRGVTGLAGLAREYGVLAEGESEEARKWLEESYGPHCSLM
jgi:hypothetical protein